MELFSHRMGLKKVRDALQIDSMSEELRNGLWNCVYIHLFSTFSPDKIIEFDAYLFGYINPEDHQLAKHIWQYYFKKAIDSLPNQSQFALHEIKKYFYKCEWYEVYDLIEFLIPCDIRRGKSRQGKSKRIKSGETRSEFQKCLNSVLERELSGYRVISNKIVSITSESEIEQIEEVLEYTKSRTTLSPVHNHLNEALNILSDRENLDYRNSIKESISAVESLCKIITGNDSATLGQSLKEIEKSDIVKIPPSLKIAFEKLYGYASSEGGIRHGLSDTSAGEIGIEDAKLMLVICSAFIGYLISKSEKASISLG